MKYAPSSYTVGEYSSLLRNTNWQELALISYGGASIQYAP